MTWRDGVILVVGISIMTVWWAVDEGHQLIRRRRRE